MCYITEHCDITKLFLYWQQKEDPQDAIQELFQKIINKAVSFAMAFRMNKSSCNVQLVKFLVRKLMISNWNYMYPSTEWPEATCNPYIQKSIIIIFIYLIGILKVHVPTKNASIQYPTLQTILISWVSRTSCQISCIHRTMLFNYTVYTYFVPNRSAACLQELLKFP